MSDFTPASSAQSLADELDAFDEIHRSETVDINYTPNDEMNEENVKHRYDNVSESKMNSNRKCDFPDIIPSTDSMLPVDQSVTQSSDNNINMHSADKHDIQQLISGQTLHHPKHQCCSANMTPTQLKPLIITDPAAHEVIRIDTLHSNHQLIISALVDPNTSINDIAVKLMFKQFIISVHHYHRELSIDDSPHPHATQSIQYDRTVSLPHPKFNVNSVKATYLHGVLTIYIDEQDNDMLLQTDTNVKILELPDESHRGII